VRSSSTSSALVAAATASPGIPTSCGCASATGPRT
jgi:hypothetical protein